MAECNHLDTVEFMDPPSEIEGCADCLAAGGEWVHLRMCQACGHVACCDSSPNRHMTAHHRETDHPIMRSVEPGEDWSWCFTDELMFRLRGA